MTNPSVRFDPTEHIIEASEGVPLLVRTRDIILTICVWVLYVWLMRDFFAFLGDIINWAAGGFANTGSYGSFSTLHPFLLYMDVVILMELLLVGWSFYNIMRYGKKKRRKFPQPVSVDQQARRYRIAAEDLKTWQSARTVVMHMDDEGRITSVEAQE
jgi:poly-beta-1,6-N-acetyl-D-glucosamine biosynthesis protein PgaD